MDGEETWNVGDFLREQREYHGLNQRELEEVSGVDATSISQYENGTRTPPIGKLVKLFDALDVKITVNSGRSRWIIEPSPKSTDKVFLRKEGEDNLPVLFEGLPEDEVEDIIRFIDRRKNRHNDE